MLWQTLIIENVQNLKKHSKLRMLFFSVSLLIIFYGIYLRIQGLGYSNFQGDEVNTLDFMFRKDIGFIDYLFEQKKGPVQFVINYINILLFGYHGEWLARFPYMVLGILAIPVWYVLSLKTFYSHKVAAISAILISLNGLFISFSRITQYQSVMYFVMPITIFAYTYALRSTKLTYWILTGVLISFLFLTHYDALSLLFFIIIATLINLRNLYRLHEKKSLQKLLLNSAVMLLVGFAVSALFYLPFIFSNTEFDSSTSGYLSSRLLGGGFMPRTEISLQLISMYFPKNWLVMLFGLSIVGAYLANYKGLLGSKYSRPVSLVFFYLCLLLLFSAVFSMFPIKPRFSSLLFISSSICISGLLTIFSNSSWKTVALTSFYLLSFSFYFFIVRDPRTHVYIAILPGILFASYALVQIYEFANSKSKILGILTIVIFFSAILYLSGLYWVIYKNKSPEYPWWDKTYFGKVLYHLSKNKRVDGVFGFNSYRGWEQIAGFYKRGCLVGTYESNEKDNLTTFYIGFKQLEGDKWSNENGADTMIVVEGPHSWQYVSKREFSGYKLLKTIYSEEVPVTYIFGKNSIYKEGKMLCN